MTFPIIADYLISTSFGRYDDSLSRFTDVKSTKRNPKQRILCLDGGGIRGVLTAAILAELEDRLIEQSGDPATRLIDYFDYVAGTSTGGILACLYLLPDPDQPGRPLYSAREVLHYYRYDGPAIFKRSLRRKLYSLMGLRREKFCSVNMENIMRGFMGDCRLKDLIRPCIIPAYDIEQKSPYYFRQELAASDPSHDYPVWQVSRATAAAPLYFGPKLVIAADGTQRPLIDGGVFANNPSMLACQMLQSMMPEALDLQVVSIGTGNTAQSFKMEDLKAKGMLNAWKPLLNIMSSATGQTVDQQLSVMLNTDDKGKYCRLNPVIKDLNAHMDDVSDQQLDGLIALGQNYVQKQKAVIDQLLKRLAKYA